MMNIPSVQKWIAPAGCAMAVDHVCTLPEARADAKGADARGLNGGRWVKTRLGDANMATAWFQVPFAMLHICYIATTLLSSRPTQEPLQLFPRRHSLVARIELF